VRAYLPDFTSYITAEKGLSKNTILAYLADAEEFIDFLEKKRAEEVTLHELVSFFSFLKEKGLEASTLARKRISLKVFFRFLKREKFILEDPTSHLDAPKLWHLIPTVLTEEEVEAILSVNDLNTHVGVRDRALLELLYASGLRVSELCSLSLYSVSDDLIRVIGKGGKERVVPVSQRAVKALDQYLLVYRDLASSEKKTALFLNLKGKPLDRITLWKMVKLITKKAKIEKHVSPHTFRHSYATHLLDRGADLRVIQELLGHSHISSTERYTHVSQKSLKESFKKNHPNYFL
jgi:integrase/recombinase XerD